MVSKSISTSECFARLTVVCPDLAEFAQSLYLLLVAHADDFGREQGDVFTVRHAIHPTSPRTDNQFTAALEALQAVGLIQWYVAAGRRYVAICKFDAHQAGLHKRTRSAFPAPPAASGKFPEVPGSSGKFPEIPLQLKRRELKRTELKGTELKGTELKRTKGKGTAAPPATAIAPVWQPNGRSGHNRSLSGSHTTCYPTPEACARGICLPSVLGAEWAHQFSDPAEAERVIAAVVHEALEALGEGPIGDDKFAFWRAVWRHRHGTRAPAPGGSKTGDTMTAARAALRDIQRQGGKL